MTALDGERRRTASRVLFALAMFACYLWYLAHHHRDVMIYRTDAISRLGAPDPIPVTSGCR